MKILADENIPLVRETFGPLGQLQQMPGRQMTSDHVRNIDVLLVRSVTRVDENLLSNSAVKYVATATIGTDHLDIPYLESRGIQWSAAPGSNAGSVADYLISCLLYISELEETPLSELSLGVIGCGNVGGLVARRARGIGMKVVENDPPLMRLTDDARFSPLKDIFGCDIITLHTPLTFDGVDATYHLVEHRFLSRMKAGGYLINTGRGAVVDQSMLKSALLDGEIFSILDVWENEPAIDKQLLQLLAFGTPHIAGYSYDGKVRGSWMIYHQVCNWLNVEPSLTYESLISSALPPNRLYLHGADKSNQDVLFEAVMQTYDVADDDSLMWTMLEDVPRDRVAEVFDSLRKNYSMRREFSSTVVHLCHGTESHASILQAAGFQVSFD